MSTCKYLVIGLPHGTNSSKVIHFLENEGINDVAFVNDVTYGPELNRLRDAYAQLPVLKTKVSLLQLEKDNTLGEGINDQDLANLLNGIVSTDSEGDGEGDPYDTEELEQASTPSEALFDSTSVKMPSLENMKDIEMEEPVDSYTQSNFSEDVFGEDTFVTFPSVSNNRRRKTPLEKFNDSFVSSPSPKRKKTEVKSERGGGGSIKRKKHVTVKAEPCVDSKPPSPFTPQQPKRQCLVCDALITTHHQSNWERDWNLHKHAARHLPPEIPQAYSCSHCGHGARVPSDLKMHMMRNPACAAANAKPIPRVETEEIMSAIDANYSRCFPKEY